MSNFKGDKAFNLKAPEVGEKKRKREEVFTSIFDSEEGIEKALNVDEINLSR